LGMWLRPTMTAVDTPTAIKTLHISYPACLRLRGADDTHAGM
jgi:hypothetical protein